MSGTGEVKVGVRVEAEAGSAKAELASVAEGADQLGKAAAEAAVETGALGAELEKVGEQQTSTGGLGDTAAEMGAVAEGAEKLGEAGATAAEEVGALDTEVKNLGQQQGAAQAMQRTAVAAEAAGAAIAKTQAQLSPVEQAFQQLGLVSTAQLQKIAEDASQAFSVIRQDGESTAADIDAAFARMAQAELAAAAAIGDARAEAVAGALEENAETERQLATVQALKAQYLDLTDEVAQAFQTLGVESAASLEETAVAAREAFETIRDSGIATAEDIDAAFKATAEAELAAAAAAGEAAVEAVAAALEAQAATDAQRAAVAALTEQYIQSGNAAAEAGEKAKAGIGLAGEALGALLGISIGAELVKQLADVADEAKNLESRLRLATDSEQQFQIATDGVRQIAEKTGTSLESTAELYYKLSNAVKTTGGSQQDLLTITKVVDEAVQLSGVSAQTASNGLIQFAQGLAAGTLQGQDLRSVLEDIPSLGQAIAQGLGVTVAQLRQLAEQGQLTPQQILAALEKVAPQIAEKFAVVPQTVGRALTDLKTAVIETIGGVDKTTAASATLAGAIESVAKTIESLGTDPAVKEAFLAVGNLFEAGLVDPVKVGVDTVSLAFHTLQTLIDAAASGIALALSKITFGDTSKAFAAAADSLAQSAQEAGEKVKADFSALASDTETQLAHIGGVLVEGGKSFADFSTGAQAAADTSKKAAANISQDSTAYVDLAAKAKAAAAVFSGDLPPAMAKMVDGFNASKSATGGAAESISTFVDDAINAKIAMADIVDGLAALDAKQAISTQQFRDGLQKTLSQVSLEDLPALIQRLQVDYAKAADTASVKTQALQQALQAANDEGFKRLGLESPQQLQKVSDATTALFTQIKSQYSTYTGLVSQAFTQMADAQLKLAAAQGDAYLATKAASLQAQAANDAQRASLAQLIAQYPQLKQASSETAAQQVQDATQAASAYDKLRASIAAAQDEQTLKQIRSDLTDMYTAGTVGAEDYQAAITATKQQSDSLLNSTEGVAVAIGNVVSTASQYYHSLSDAAGKAFDDMARSIIVDGESINEYWDRLAQVTATLTQRQNEQTQAAQFYTDQLQKQNGATESMISLAQYAATNMKYLDSQTLSQLTSAIDTAKQALDDLDSSASTTLSDMQDQLDTLEGNTLAIQTRQNDAKRQEIQSELAQAKAAGDTSAIQQLNQALQLLDQIQAVQTQQAQQNSSSTQQTPSPSTPQVAGQIAVQFTDANGQETAYFDNQDAANGFLNMLKRQKGVSIVGVG